MKAVNLRLPGLDDYFTREAYNVLRTNIQFCGQDVKVITVTSCGMNEGKTVVSLHIGRSMASLGKKVLVIDADLRKSVMSGRNANVKETGGLSEVLSGQKELGECIYQTQFENMHIMFSGKYPPNPVELLDSRYFSQIIDAAKTVYDYVIIDTPPLGMVIDAAITASKSDSAIFVIGNQGAKNRNAKELVEQLEKSGCKVLGVVLNSVQKKTKSRYYRDNKYYGYYGSSDEYDPYSNVEALSGPGRETEPEVLEQIIRETKITAAELGNAAAVNTERRPEIPKMNIAESVEPKSDTAVRKPLTDDEKIRSIMERHEMMTAKNTKAGKRKKKKGRKALKTIVIILVILALLLAAAAVALSLIGRQAMTNDGSSMDVAAAGATDEGDTIRYKGKLYRYNNKVSSVLFMGIDDYSKSGDVEYGESNQADVDVLAVIDPVSEKLTLISISRDTMCSFEVFDSEGKSQGVAEGQLALAYSYGTTPAQACRTATNAVSKIFYDLDIPAYGSIYMDGIVDLVDMIGGISIIDDNGKEIDLSGTAARKYIQYREHTVGGNNERMKRQSKVINALIYKMLASAKQNPTSILNMYNTLSSNIETNLNAAKIVYLAEQATKLGYDGEIYKVPGQSRLSEDGKHAEYMIDDDAFFEMILDTFYIPVEG